MRLAVGAYSGPRAVCGAVAQLAKNAMHVAAAMRRDRTDIFECLGFMRFRGVASNVIMEPYSLSDMIDHPALVVRLTRQAVLIAFKGEVRLHGFNALSIGICFEF